MPTQSLPDDPNFEQLRKQAKTLQRSVRSGSNRALDAVRELHPRPELADGDAAELAAFRLSDAQLVTARRYGFESWPKLKAHLELRERYTRRPVASAEDLVAADLGDGDVDIDELATRFVRLACLTYEQDDPGRIDRARQLLADHPELGGYDLATAAVVGDVATVERLLADDPDAARRTTGPLDWEPLLYVTYARVGSTAPGHSSIEVARRLLAAGADPNAGFLWHGLTSPFTALTGAFGEGEGGPVAQPRHPQALLLARLLLEAGADANDGQALYNRMFLPDDDHLVLLFAFGLGAGDGGPWRRRLGPAMESPAEMLERQLVWAVAHDFAARVALLLDHGVPVTVTAQGVGLHELAVLQGNTAAAQVLLDHGVVPAELAPAEQLVAAALRVDRDAVAALVATDPALPGRAAADHADALVRAVRRQDGDAVRLLVELGFAVDAMVHEHRDPAVAGTTALHAAAEDGSVAMAELLLSLGADPTIHDLRFDATPLGWAEHCDQPAVADLLRPLSPTS